MLRIKNITKIFKGKRVINDVSFDISSGEVLAIIGPSGGGKSTLLRCINGLDNIDEGSIDMDKEERVGMVFQQFNLFNNMTLLENLTYPQMTVLKRTKEESHKVANQIIRKMNLSGLESYKPKHLSGGQKQRGAIARTLCMDPTVILFDEPTSALDPENVREVLNAIKDVASGGITTIIVTHEMSFAKDIATRVIFLEDGKVTADLPKDEFFYIPKSPRIKSFLEKVL